MKQKTSKDEALKKANKMTVEIEKGFKEADVNLNTQLRKGITKPSLSEKLGKPEVLYISKYYNSIDYKYDRPLAFCEKVGADFYHYLSDNSFENPKVRFNIAYYGNSNDVYSVGICSKYNKDFMPFGKDNKPNILPSGDVLIKNPDNNQELITIQGYLRMLAIGEFLGDWDVVGSEGDNAGFLFESQGKIAKCMKIDPGMSFSGPKGSGFQFPLPTIFKIVSEKELNFLKNNPDNFLELSNAIHDIVNLTDDEIALLIKGDNENRRFDTIPFQDTYLIGKENPQEALKQYQNQLVNVMIERRNHMKEFYKETLQWREQYMASKSLSSTKSPAFFSSTDDIKSEDPDNINLTPQ